jgi:uncharacterized protein YdhG (YjbR/CyaY superfamily)
MAGKPRTIDEYLDGLSDDRRAVLEKLRKAIRAEAPKAEECIAYGVPSFRLGGKFLVAFGAGAKHCSFYSGAAAIEVHAAELAGYDMSKGTIKFQPKAGLSAKLVRKLVKVRMAKVLARANK